MQLKLKGRSNIAKTADWNRLLGGKTDLHDVSVEEKSEFGRYSVDFDVADGKLKIRTAILNDQFLREFFSEFTFPVYKTSDFDELPIPFRAVDTDIVNGDELILKSGSLALAMRASMSIPSVFKPVPYKEILLVDGGILNNFPVDIARDWGAEIIIGSDVGGGMLPKEELKGISNILFQSAMLVSNKKNPENRAMCDILLDHLPNLRFSTSDFQKAHEIYEDGFIATKLKLDDLVHLSNELSEFKQIKKSIPKVNSLVTLDTIIYKGISEFNIDLVKARSNIKAGKEYTVSLRLSLL